MFLKQIFAQSLEAKYARGSYQTDSSQTLNADQSNIYSCVQPVTDVKNSQRILAKTSVLLSKNSEFFDLFNLMKPFIKKKSGNRQT